MAKQGEIKEGDIFSDGDRRIFVKSFIKEPDDIFIVVYKYKPNHVMEEDCISIKTVYGYKFIENIIDL